MKIAKKIKGSILCKLPMGLVFELKKIYYAFSLKTFSEKKEKDIVMVKNIVKPGDHVVDIGAHIGWYTKVLSGLVGNQGRVYCIEPVSSTFELLTFCVKKLKLSNVVLFNCAISDMDGSAMMEVPNYEGVDNFYRAKITGKEDVDQSLKHYEVGLKSLDSLSPDFSGRISFIKCDVEGHELKVVEGSKRVIANFKPAWLIEISGNPENKASDTSKVFTILEKEGYRAWWFDGRQLKKYCPGDRSINYFFFTDYHLSSVLKEKDLHVV